MAIKAQLAYDEDVDELCENVADRHELEFEVQESAAEKCQDGDRDRQEYQLQELTGNFLFPDVTIDERRDTREKVKKYQEVDRRVHDAVVFFGDDRNAVYVSELGILIENVTSSDRKCR